MPAPNRCLTSGDLRRFIDERCFPAAPTGLVGAELEWLTGTRPHAIDVGALPGRSAVTFEPGGQLELSSRPLSTLGAVCEALAADTRAVREMGTSLLGVGLDPERPPVRVIDSGRYRAMEAFFRTGGETSPGAGATMMCSTAAVQVNLESGSASAEREQRWRRAHLVLPLLAGLFANSPVAAGRPTGWASTRLATWRALDRSRTASAYAGNGCVEDWARYASSARVMMIRAGEHDFVPITTGLTFARWMEQGHELGWPTEEDLAYHLTTLFPPVRPRGWLEVRVIDALPSPWWRVAIALATAMLDDDEVAERTEAACSRLGGRWEIAARWGLEGAGSAEAATVAFSVAMGALPRLGADPATIAACEEFAERFVARGRCPADDVLEALIGASA